MIVHSDQMIAVFIGFSLNWGYEQQHAQINLSNRAQIVSYKAHFINLSYFPTEEMLY